MVGRVLTVRLPLLLHALLRTALQSANMPPTPASAWHRRRAGCDGTDQGTEAVGDSQSAACPPGIAVQVSDGARTGKP